MKISLENNSCILTVDSFGGAIVDFHLKDDKQINPLSFAFTQEQMPANNKNGAPYQGHFLCAGRWGLPSEGEIKSGIPNHGEAANIAWTVLKNNDNLIMQTTAKLEGLHIKRIIELDPKYDVFAVTETFTNINPLGRLYNIVQHPTLAAPFLNSLTIINCNAAVGFNQLDYLKAESNSFLFPDAEDKNGNIFSLKNPLINYNSVFSFVVDKNNDIGWLTSYSPMHNLLFGYVWKRDDYPWINLWQHWNDNKLVYRGIEFGTTGIHEPFEKIINTATELFGEKTLAYINAGESVHKKYFSFIYKTEEDLSDIENVTVNADCINIKTRENNIIKLAASFNLKNELSK